MIKNNLIKITLLILIQFFILTSYNSVNADTCNHTFGAYITNKYATCEEDGSETRTCTACGYEETKTLEKIGHAYRMSCHCGTEDMRCRNCNNIKFHFVAKPADSASFWMSYNGLEYNIIQEGSYYKLTGDSKATNAGKYKITVSIDDPSLHKFEDGTSSYYINWEISPKDLWNDLGKGVTLSWNIGTYIYNGSEQKAVPTITEVLGKMTYTLEENVDYKVTYANNINATETETNPARAEIKIEGIGNYFGEISAAYSIKQKEIVVIWGEENEFIYDGTAKAPTATAITGVDGEEAIIVRTQEIEASDSPYTSIASLGGISGGNENVSNYILTNTKATYTITKNTEAYIAIVFEDENGEKVDKEWYNSSITIKPDSSIITGNGSDIGFKYKFDNEEYQNYISPIVYNQTFNYEKIYFKAYNKNTGEDASEEVSRSLPKMDNTAPIISINSNTKWAKKQTAEVMLQDEGASKLKAKEYVLYYTWTQTEAEPAIYDSFMTIIVPENNKGTYIAEIERYYDTGIWYCHAKLSEQLEDKAGNATNDLKVTGCFYLDNIGPEITLKQNHSLQVLAKKDMYKIEIEVKDTHSGINKGAITAADIDVLWKTTEERVNVTKSLIYVSTSTVDNVDVHLYELGISNFKETGKYIIRINRNKIEDEAGNSNYEINFREEQLGLTSDNAFPKIALYGPIEVKTLVEEDNLSGAIDERYINKKYKIIVPVEINDVGIIDIQKGLTKEDIFVYAGDILTAATVEVELKEETETENYQTEVKTFTKKYHLIISGISNNGYLKINFEQGAIIDAAENKNQLVELKPYAIKDEIEHRVYVDNTPPRIALEDISEKIVINNKTDLSFKIKVTDKGAGIREDEFVASDVILEMDGQQDSMVTLMEVIPNENNDYNTALGESNEDNYRYTLLVKGTKKDGELRVKISANNIIDKANNGNEVITLDAYVTIDNSGPKIGMITTNADISGKVYGENVIIKVENCYDEHEIEKYVWERSSNEHDWEVIKEDVTNASKSEVENEVLEDGRYYYRLKVIDKIGNETLSETIVIDYAKAIQSRPIIRLQQYLTRIGEVNILATITSTVELKSVKVNNSEISSDTWDVNSKKFQLTTNVYYNATSNGIYKFFVEDEAGNTVEGSINVNLVDISKAEITYSTENATNFEDARIIFTSNEEIRIINPNAFVGITYNTSNFTKRVIATIEKGTLFNSGTIFIFENKALLQTEVEVTGEIITVPSNLRFGEIGSPILGITVAKANKLTNRMPEEKIISNGKIDSYYGFGREEVNTQIAGTAEFSAVLNLASATKIEIIDQNGKKTELKKTTESTSSQDTNCVNGNVSGMYKKTTNTMEPTQSQLIDEITQYNAFRVVIKVK